MGFMDHHSCLGVDTPNTLSKQQTQAMVASTLGPPRLGHVSKRFGGVLSRCCSSHRAKEWDFGIAFDIDGVLIRGGEALPGAKQVLQTLQKHAIPHIFLTNGGGYMEEVKAAIVSERLGYKIDPKLLIQSHTPMREIATQYGDARVLILGCHDVLNVARNYGFHKAIGMEDLARHCPTQYPFMKWEYKQAPFHGEPIDAILVMHDPINWAPEIQIAIDVLIGGDPLGSGRPDGSQTPLFVSNDDFIFSGAYPMPRFAQGAFTRCLQLLYEQYTGKSLEITRYGKPHGVTYRYAERLLNESAGRDPKKNPLRAYYGIGDNPHSDIQGANDAGDRWTSVLVQTGIFDGTGVPPVQPNLICTDVKQAVNEILKRHHADLTV